MYKTIQHNRYHRCILQDWQEEKERRKLLVTRCLVRYKRKKGGSGSPQLALPISVIKKTCLKSNLERSEAISLLKPNWDQVPPWRGLIGVGFEFHREPMKWLYYGRNMIYIAIFISFFFIPLYLIVNILKNCIILLPNSNKARKSLVYKQDFHMHTQACLESFGL